MVSSRLEAFSGLARRRRGGGTCRGLQRAGRRGDIRVGGIDPGVRASHRDSGDWRVRDRDFGVAGDFGTAPDFHVGKLAVVGAQVRPLFFLFGVIAGGAAVLYSEALLGVMSLAQSIDRRFVGLYAALTGAVVGAVAWLAPDLVGGGDAITQNTLLGTQPLLALLFVFLFRFGFGAVSYATATPGGIFAPMLVLGAQLGLIYGRICQFILPGLELQPVGFAVVGIAAFFTGVVRAPLTGIVLATEMTANVELLLPMLGACFAAMLAPTLLRSAPIYDFLRELALQRIGVPPENISTAEKPADARRFRHFQRFLPLFGFR